MRKIYILIALLVVVGVGAATLIITGKKNIEPIACTMEAKLCPDGTAVGRTGPNCEFAECPTAPGDTNTLSNLIKVSAPAPGELVHKNFSITGEARGIWFFEASFPVVVLGKDGEVLVRTHATAKSDWMTENFVPFLSDIIIPEFYTGPIKVILKKDNPSGIASRDASISLDLVAVSDIKKDANNMGIISGRVTLSPVCPVERMPPDPQCAPKPYQTSVKVFSVGESYLIKSVQTGVDGSFTLTLPFGNYTIGAVGGAMLPRCSPVEVSLKTATTSVDISCDTGIR